MIGMWALAALACSASDDAALVGTLERTQLELVAPVSELIRAIPVERGEQVDANAPVVQLDPTLANAAEQRAEAALTQARKAERVAAHELERERELSRTRVASDQALERMELAQERAKAALREAETALAVARKHRADMDLRSPTAAVVDQLPYEVGERVPAGAVLAVLLAKDRPWVRVWLPEPRLATIHPGTEAVIFLDGWPDALRGRVLEIAREPTFTPHYALTERERAHLTYETRVELIDAPEGVRPGIPATVELKMLPAAKDVSVPLFIERGGEDELEEGEVR